MSNLFAAYLRRPHFRNDSRSDPYYVKGSFGSTGCHSKNLLHPVKSKVRLGDRLCFIQGGNMGPRIVYVTPSVRVKRVRVGRELRMVVFWDPSPPLKYENALRLSRGLARALNPNMDNPELAHSHLRTFSRPAVNSELVLREYDDWCATQARSVFATSDDRQTLDPADQRKMSLDVYGMGDHFAPGTKILDWCKPNANGADPSKNSKSQYDRIL
jgi:hypothetical protein